MRKIMLRILGSLGELNISHSSKVVTFKIDSANYGLLLYTSNICRISFFKLNLNESIFKDLNDSKLYAVTCEKEKYEFVLLRVFNFSFSLVQVISTDNNIWVVGLKAVVDLKPYIESVLKEIKSANDEEYMDIDDDADTDEFRPEIYSTNVDAPKFEKYDFHQRDVYIACDFLERGFILCHKLPNLRKWELTLLNAGTSQSSEMNVTSFLDFPISDKEIAGAANYQEDRGFCDPAVIFVHYNDPERLIFESLFGIKVSSSNAVCIVGHSDGKIMWYLCDGNKKFHSSVKSQVLCDTGQSVIAMYFVKDIEEVKDSVCMLIVGGLGQITLLSSKRHASSSVVSGTHPFWIKTVHLKSSIRACVIVKERLVHFSSNEKLWITNIPKLFNCDQAEDICLASNCSELSNINQMVVIERNKGLLLLGTSSGNLYLTLCGKEAESEVLSLTLPALMNECLTQSTSMQELLQKKAVQSRLFAAVSTFASLKFSDNILKEPIAFSVSEINLQPKKYILVINLKCFEHLQLDPEICHVSASVFTYVESNNSLVSKTVAYNPEEPTLCLELTDTILQPPFESVFPLLVEIGLILQLPNKWKVIDCFRTVSQCLPFYLRVQTFMVHELHLFQSNVLCSPPSFKQRKPRTYEIIKEIEKKRPISNVLLMKSPISCDFPVKFNLCLSASSVELLMKDTNALDAVTFIKHLLFGNKDLNKVTEAACKTSKFCPLSVAAAKNDNTVVITVNADMFDSLIALRLAVIDIILSSFNKTQCSLNPSAYVNIPASIYRRCEEISKSLVALYGSDIESDAVAHSLLQLYEEFRTDISGKLPIL